MIFPTSYHPTIKTLLSNAVKSAPNESGCYRMFFKGELIYIGKAVDLKKRLSEYLNGSAGKHPSSQYITENSTEIEVIYALVPSNKILEVEKNLIRTFSPLLNKRNSIWLRGEK